MDTHKELTKLVVSTLECKRAPATAFMIYQEITEVRPILVRKGFKSFVQIVKAMPNVAITEIPGKADLYWLKK